MKNKKNKYWGRRYSAREISEAEVRKNIIVLWQGGGNLSELVKNTGINMSRQAWSLAKKRYEEYGFAGLLDRRGTKGGRKRRVAKQDLLRIKDLADNDTLSREFEQTINKELGIKYSVGHSRRLLNQLGFLRKRGRPLKLYIADKAKGTAVDHAGTYFLKGADADMAGAAAITEQILEGRQKSIPEELALKRLREMGQETIRKRVETLLYLPMFNLQKPYHLLKYHKRGLGLLTGSGHRYSYYTTDLFLGDVEKLEIASDVGDALARCYLEALCIEIELEDGSYFYIDGHAKHVWSDSNIPKVFFTTLKRAERGLHQYFIHSTKGDPLILLTCPGDSRLPGVIFNLIESFENAVGKQIVKAAIFDREGLSLSIFEEFDRQKKYLITLLRQDMYKGEDSFNILKEYVPVIRRKKNGEEEILYWVAEAEYILRDKDRKKQLKVRVALVRKQVNNTVKQYPQGKTKLIPIITNLTRTEEPDIRRIVKRYFARWPNQENIFRDAREAFKVDTNHGYKKEPVVNRVVLRKKEELETNMRGITIRLKKATREKEKARLSLEKMKELYGYRKNVYQREISELYAQLGLPQSIEDRRSYLKRLKLLEGKLRKATEKFSRIISGLENKLKNKEQYERSLGTQQENKELEINSLNLEKVLFEIQTEKDHLMSNFKMLLINLSSYAQRQYFPQSCQKFNLESMKKIFFQQDGYVKKSKTRIDVTLHSYDEPDLQRAAEYACKKFNDSDPRTVEGQRIYMNVAALEN